MDYKSIMVLVILSAFIIEIETVEEFGIHFDRMMGGINLFIESCEKIFQFPSDPVHMGHIRFLYENQSLKSNSNSLIIPDYVCYDAELCDCIKPTFIYKNLSCLHSSKFDLISSVSGHIWIDMILSIDSYFRSCLTSDSMHNTDNLTRSLYSCQNSSKLISKDRIGDENVDCCNGDDEDNEYSCLINTSHRVKCLNENKCLSSLHTKDDCRSNENENDKKIPFRILCDGLKEVFFKDSNGLISTDESSCDSWPCNNIYTKCDGFWSCPNGEDEENCYERICEKGKYECLSPLNYSLICLSNDKIGDGINDCLGSTDELHFCRRVYPSEKNPKRFRCRESDLCLSINQLCDNIQTCPLADDELFCQNNTFTCQQKSIINRTIIEHILCQLDQNEKNRIIHFSIHTSPMYPQIETTEQIIQWKSEQNHIVKHINLKKNSYPWPWYCNRGLILRLRSENKRVCMCPPSYYGHLCQYQNERVSITLGLITSERRDVYQILILLISYDNLDEEIEYFDQFEYVASQSCGIKLNRYLLYSTRPKNISKNYNIHIDVFEKNDMTYRGRWHLSIPFLFLPVNRLSALLLIPSKESLKSSSCLRKCLNGECIKYINKDESYCRCKSGWSGIECNIQINCKSCSSDSICYGIINNRSICICPLMKFGDRCLLHSSCPENACQNKGQCIPSDMSLSINNYSCICPEEYYGLKCQYSKSKINIQLEYLNIPSYLLAYFLTITNQSEPRLTIMLQKLTLFQRLVTFRISIPFNIIIIKSDLKYYLAVVQQYPNKDISTTINPSRECISIKYLLNSTILKKSRYERIKSYHIPCQINVELNCFIDEYYLCLCTKDHHANCVEFNWNKNVECSSKESCLNGGKCLQDDPNCPSSIICVCMDCFFGNQCQFYAKGLGLTLDEILGYEIKLNKNLFQQPFSVKLSSIITMIMLTAGIINCVLSILTFKNKICQEVGCGIYLLTSAIISLFIVFLFTFKFWFLIYSFKQFKGQKIIIFLNCFIIEPLLKVLLYIDNWLNGCVAGERAFAVFKGISFDKKRSKQMAKWIIILVILINVILLIPQIINLHLFYDKKENRTWCGILYSSLLNNYNLFLIYFHFFAPFLINIFSSIFIIIGTAHQRVQIQNQYRFTNHFKTKLKQHKHLLISPLILIILSLPRLIISFTLDCKKSSQHFWLYLIGYFISFMPSVSIFMVFVVPSPTYKKEFKQVLTNIQTAFSFNTIKSFTNKRP